MPANRTFSDIDFAFGVHPSTGDVLKVYDVNSIKQSVKALVMTEFYGRPFHPEIGSSAAGLLFEPWSPLVDKAIETTIIDVLENWEPRAELVDVTVIFREGQNEYFIEVEFYLRGLMQEVNIDFILERVR